jgi:hypothetical protein
VAAELARLAPLCRSRAKDAPVDPKAWARKIMQRHESGKKINVYPLRCARQALGLPEPEPVYRTRPSAARADHVPAPPPAAPAPAQAMTPAEAYFAAEQAARQTASPVATA